MDNDPKKIPVEWASLHAAIQVPHAGPNTETTLSQKKMPGSVMFWTPHALIMEWKGLTILIPHANVKCALLNLTSGKEEKKNAKVN